MHVTRTLNRMGCEPVRSGARARGMARPLRWLPLWALAPAITAQVTEYPRAVRTVLADHCFDCHAGRDVEGDLDLERLPATSEAAFLARLLRVRDKVRTAAMPPASQPALSMEERDGLVRWIETTVATRAAALPVEHKGPTIRRLSRGQLVAALRDLFGVSSPAVDGLPADDLGHGFDTVADALSFSTLHLEKYLAVAREVAAQVIDSEDPGAPTVRRTEAEAVAENVDGVSVAGDFANFYTNAELGWTVDLPRAGRYALRARAFGDQAGDAAPRMELSVDRVVAGGFAVPEEADAPTVKEATVALEAGVRRIAVRFTNDYYAPEHPDPSRRDRNLRVDWVDVVGPLDARLPPAGNAWWLADADTSLEPTERARRLLAPLLERAWRRPVDAAALDDMVAVVTAALARGETWATALRSATVAVLCAPSFLFRVDGAGADATRQYELAARLSFFLWSSVPDAALLEHARAGRLDDPGVWRGEVARLLRDARASALATEFAAQWLELRSLRDMAPDPGRFGAIAPVLLADMQRETELLFEAILREGRDVRELLTADFTFLNRRLAEHYGLWGIDSEDLRRVRVPDARRAGILGHAGILTLTSNPTRTSVVKRGKWVLENLLADPPPPPPPGTATLEGARIDSAADLRTQMARHSADETCAVCHSRMDGLGFALESLDAVGRWRTAAEPIDDRGSLPGGRTVHGVNGLRAHLAAEPAFPRALATRLFVYAVGRLPDAADRVQIEAMVQACETHPVVTVGDLILGVTTLPGFRGDGLLR